MGNPSFIPGLFVRDWYCSNCHTALKRKDVIYQSENQGYYTTYWYRCLKCGNKYHISTLKDKVIETIQKTK